LFYNIPEVHENLSLDIWSAELLKDLNCSGLRIIAALRYE
jgi:hypothetical protein